MVLAYVEDIGRTKHYKCYATSSYQEDIMTRLRGIMEVPREHWRQTAVTYQFDGMQMR